jgi:hypothetical protein
MQGVHPANAASPDCLLTNDGAIMDAALLLAMLAGGNVVYSDACGLSKGFPHEEDNDL